MRSSWLSQRNSGNEFPSLDCDLSGRDRVEVLAQLLHVALDVLSLRLREHTGVARVALQFDYAIIEGN
jgi:hypothetical protein